MEEIKLTPENYTDFSAVRYFEALGVERLAMTRFFSFFDIMVLEILDLEERWLVFTLRI